MYSVEACNDPYDFPGTRFAVVLQVLGGVAMYLQCRCTCFLQVKNISSQLEQCQQPQRYLIEGLQQKDKEIEAVKNGSHKLEARVRYDDRESLNKSSEIPTIHLQGCI